MVLWTKKVASSFGKRSTAMSVVESILKASKRHTHCVTREILRRTHVKVQNLPILPYGKRLANVQLKSFKQVSLMVQRNDS